MKMKDIQKRVKEALEREYNDNEVKEYLNSFNILAQISKRAYEDGRKDQAELDRQMYGVSFKEFNYKYKPILPKLKTKEDEK